MKKSVPDPPPENPANETVTDLLRCASVTAYQCGDQLEGADRAMVYSIWHLLEIAKAMVDRSIECLGMKQG